MTRWRALLAACTALAAVAGGADRAHAQKVAPRIAVVSSDQPAFAEAARAAIEFIGPDAALVRADDSARDIITAAAVTVAVGPLAERLVAATLPKGSLAVACLVPRATTGLSVPLHPSAQEVLSLVRAALPAAKIVGVFPAASTSTTDLESTARASGLKVVVPQRDEPFASASDRIVAAADVLWIQDAGAIPAGGTQVIVKRASDAKKAVFGPNRASVVSGALAAVVPDPVAHGRSAGEAAQRLARGETVDSVPAPPGRIVLNQALARTLGVKLPAKMQARVESIE